MVIKDLLNGTYWLLNVCGPSIIDYYIVHNKVDPINDLIMNKSIDLMEHLCAGRELMSNHKFLNKTKEEYIEYLNNLQENINIESQVITQKVIDKYGEQFFLDFINTNNLFKQQLLYKKI